MSAAPYTVAPRGRRLIWLGYWLVLAVSTHVPPSTLSKIAPRLADWILHGTAFLILGFLTGWATAAGKPARDWLLRAVILCVYGALDELTQPLTQRAAEWSDWTADVTGICIGVLAGFFLMGSRGGQRVGNST